MESSSVEGMLNELGVVKADGPIRHESFNEELQLVGFLPYNTNLSLVRYIDLNGKLNLTPYMTRYSEDFFVIKIMKYVKIDKTNKFFLTSNDILPIKNVMKELTKRNLYNEIRKYNSYMDNPTSDNAKSLINMLESQVKLDFLLKDDAGQIYYDPEKHPMFFYRDIDDKDCVADAFLCLCSYTNPVTGLLSYVGFPPEECICTLEEKQGEIKEHPIKQPKTIGDDIDNLF